MHAAADRLVTLADVRAARMVLDGVLRHTPLEFSRALEPYAGGAAYLKCEHLQRTGSFKIRGAYVRIARLTPEERSRGVVAASAGNHAQGVALAASMLGVQARVFMPVSVPLPKLAATKAYGAQVELVGDDLGGSLMAAQDHAQRTGAVFIHPFDSADVIAGQGTVGLEILEQCPSVRTILVGTGGGGLLSGIGAAVKGLRPEAAVVGVQASGAAAFPPSLAAGRPVTLESMHTMADGIAVPRPAEITYANVTAYADEVVTVDEEAISRALLLCLERAKMMTEPAGAASVAALLQHAGRFEPPVVAVLSGGNIDPVLLMRVVQHGMVAAGRYLSLRLTVPDSPGSLARLLGAIAGVGANVLDIEHSRIDSDLHLGEVQVDVRLETKGQGHQAEVVGSLREHGYGVLAQNDPGAE